MGNTGKLFIVFTCSCTVIEIHSHSLKMCTIRKTFEMDHWINWTSIMLYPNVTSQESILYRLKFVYIVPLSLVQNRKIDTSSNNHTVGTDVMFCTCRISSKYLFYIRNVGEICCAKRWIHELVILSRLNRKLIGCVYLCHGV